MRIRVRGTQCRLLEPDTPEVKHLLDKPGFRAGRLVTELERAGICLNPSDDAAPRAIAPSAIGAGGAWANDGGARGKGDAGGVDQEDEVVRGVVLKERWGSVLGSQWEVVGNMSEARRLNERFVLCISLRTHHCIRH